MRKSQMFFGPFAVFAALAASCGDVPDAAVEGSAISAQGALLPSAEQQYPLQMGNTNQTVGTVTVWNDGTTLFVNYTTLPGFYLLEAHVCASLLPLPWTPPGRCGYQVSPFPFGTTSHTFEIPLEALGIVECEDVIHLQAHATILNDLQVAVGSAYAGLFKGQVAFDVTCDPPPEEYEGCTYTQGFWKNKPKAWPVEALTIGGVTYSKKELIALLRTPPRGGDASLILAHQLIAALLNVANGADTPLEVADAIDAAELWMTAESDGELPYGTLAASKDECNSEAWDEAIALAAVLDLFNNGDFGPVHCD